MMPFRVRTYRTSAIRSVEHWAFADGSSATLDVYPRVDSYTPPSVHVTHCESWAEGDDIREGTAYRHFTGDNARREAVKWLEVINQGRTWH